ncbi:MAG: polysaccharide biosynthesis protein [Lachnospiraceae bacterium]|nr:polysaccharide biosynthesis protein [Lachnospiraceae bacterium]
MNERLKKNLVLQGSILAVAGLISKVIGFIYRIPMANIMGNTGNGLYSVAFGLYNIALTLSSYSMPLAISKLMSARLTKGDKKNAHRLFHDALVFAICTGLIASVALYLGAEKLAVFYKKQGLEMPLRVLAPTVFVVAVLGCCRGFFQGHRNMVPTAISQVIEQIVNAVVSVSATAYFVGIATGENAAAYGAMGGTFGTLAGAGTALVLFGFIFIARQLLIKKKEGGPDLGDMPAEDHKLLVKAIFLTVLPVIISQSIYQLGYTLDDFIYGNLMVFKGVDQNTATQIQGVFNTQYNQMINLPTAIATAMASATLPSIVASFTRGEQDKVRAKTDSVIKINMLVAIPSAIGLAVLAEPIMGVLFPKLGDKMEVAVMLLRTGSTAVIFYALSTLSTSILQGCDHMRLPVVHSGISLAIHVAVVAGCLYFTDLGVYALIIGNVSFPLLVCILNCRSIVKLTGYKFRVKDSFIKPLEAAFVMGMAAYLVYTLLKGFVGMLIAMAASMLVAMAVYIVMLIVLKAVTPAELKRMIKRR